MTTRAAVGLGAEAAASAEAAEAEALLTSGHARPASSWLMLDACCSLTSVQSGYSGALRTQTLDQHFAHRYRRHCNRMELVTILN